MTEINRRIHEASDRVRNAIGTPRIQYEVRRLRAIVMCDERRREIDSLLKTLGAAEDKVAISKKILLLLILNREDREATEALAKIERKRATEVQRALQAVNKMRQVAQSVRIKGVRPGKKLDPSKLDLRMATVLANLDRVQSSIFMNVG